jgi:hypothetical protein
VKLFGLTDENEFKEYVKTPFQVQFEETVLEDWLERNPRAILEDGALLVIGRQVTTNLGSIIDLLGVDRQGSLVVVELKRDRTPRETLAQALEYASFVEMLDHTQIEKILQSYLRDENTNLAEYHRSYFQLNPDEAIVFNREQRIVLVGQVITPDIRQTATFLRHQGLRVTCLEFSLFETEEKRRLLSADIVVGKEAPRVEKVTAGSLPKTDQKKFLDSLDDNGRPFFEHLLEMAARHHLLIRWGVKGFSLNVPHQGGYVAFCFGYPPESGYRQSVNTGFYWAGGLNSKLEISAETLQTLYNQAQNTGFFIPSGQELRCLLNRRLNPQEIEWLIGFFEQIIGVVKKYPLKGK